VANRKLSEVATEASWGWLTEDIQSTLLDMSRKAGARYDALDADDVFQEMCLYLAVRPGDTTSRAHIVRKAHICILNMAEQAGIEAGREVSLEELLAAPESEW